MLAIKDNKQTSFQTSKTDDMMVVNENLPQSVETMVSPMVSSGASKDLKEHLKDYFVQYVSEATMTGRNRIAQKIVEQLSSTHGGETSTVSMASVKAAFARLLKKHRVDAPLEEDDVIFGQGRHPPKDYKECLKANKYENVETILAKASSFRFLLYVATEDCYVHLDAKDKEVRKRVEKSLWSYCKRPNGTQRKGAGKTPRKKKAKLSNDSIVNTKAADSSQSRARQVAGVVNEEVPAALPVRSLRLLATPKKAYKEKDSDDDGDDGYDKEAQKLQVGSKISIWWITEKRYYDAQVKKIKRNKGGVKSKFQIRYDDDGANEWVDLKLENWKHLTEKKKRREPTSSKKPPRSNKKVIQTPKKKQTRAHPSAKEQLPGKVTQTPKRKPARALIATRADCTPPPSLVVNKKEQELIVGSRIKVWWADQKRYVSATVHDVKSNKTSGAKTSFCLEYTTATGGAARRWEDLRATKWVYDNCSNSEHPIKTICFGDDLKESSVSSSPSSASLGAKVSDEESCARSSVVVATGASTVEAGGIKEYRDGHELQMAEQNPTKANQDETKDKSSATGTTQAVVTTKNDSSPSTRNFHLYGITLRRGGTGPTLEDMAATPITTETLDYFLVLPATGCTYAKVRAEIQEQLGPDLDVLDGQEWRFVYGATNGGLNRMTVPQESFLRVAPKPADDSKRVLMLALLGRRQ